MYFITAQNYCNGTLVKLLVLRTALPFDTIMKLKTLRGEYLPSDTNTSLKHLRATAYQLNFNLLIDKSDIQKRHTIEISMVCRF